MENLKIAVDNNSITKNLEALMELIEAEVVRIDRVHQVVIENAINETLEVSNYAEYFGNAIGKGGFYVDRAFEEVYYGEDFKKVRKELLKLKKAFEDQKLKNAGEV